MESGVTELKAPSRAAACICGMVMRTGAAMACVTTI